MTTAGPGLNGHAPPPVTNRDQAQFGEQSPRAMLPAGSAGRPSPAIQNRTSGTYGTPGGTLSVTTPPSVTPERWSLRVVLTDGDRLRRASMWLLASGVAAIAAIVSYSHIYDLGRAHGGSGTAARLLPLSVDMLIVVGELMLLHEADVKGRRFVLGWVLVWSGILATLAANVTYGAAYGIVGALIWGWPAYSFILAAGGMVAVVKRAAARQDGDTEPATIPPPADDKKPPPDPPKGRQDGRAKAAAIIKRNPGLPDAEVAKRAGVSERTVQRARAAAR